jgi:hypothetical protein
MGKPPRTQYITFGDDIWYLKYYIINPCFGKKALSKSRSYKKGCKE